MKKQIEIPLKKKKAKWLILFWVLFFLALQLFRRYADGDYLILHYVSVLVGALGIMPNIMKLFKLGLVINEEGIIDNSTVVGLIPWVEIDEIKKIELSNNKFLIINVKDPMKYLNKARNIFQRKKLSAINKEYNSPIRISANKLNIGFDELQKTMNEYQLSKTI